MKPKIGRTLGACAFAAALVAAVALLRSAAGATETACPNAMTQRAIDACMEAAVAKSHAAEQAAYAALLAGKHGAGRTRLAAAEKAWYAARERSCLAQAQQYAGGSVAGTMLEGCREQSDRRRTAVLRAQRSAPP